MRTNTNEQPPKKPNIKILLYTDDPQIAPTNDFGHFFGLGSMIERLQAHAPTFANLEIKWASRNSDATHHADNKLDAILSQEVTDTKEPFDEIWFFGLHQSNTNRFSLLARRGGPESELNQAELDALTEWMKVRDDGYGGGGVLMTGDHSNETPSNVLAGRNGHCATTVTNPAFLGLGRALGRCVPRAGSLRRWEGPPSYHSADSFSTISSSGFQTDRLPQQLQLRPVNVDGDPDPNGEPHPLFFFKEGTFIQVFPDHGHEGAVITPDEDAPLDPKMWPLGPNGQPTRPHVVAFGRDARKSEPLNIIATYNGDLSGVGRIVADSTWHHYMNLNLRGFPHPAPEGSPSDQVGQFYANLAVWLAPKRKREQMARWMIWELARYTLCLEEREDAKSTGATGQSVLAMVSSPCEIHQMLQAITPREVAELYHAQGSEIQLPSRQMVIGSVLKSCHNAMLQAETNEAAAAAATAGVGVNIEDAVQAGILTAFQQHIGQLRKSLQVLGGSPNTSTDQTRIQTETPQRRNGAMACIDPKEEWTIRTLTDARPGRTSAEEFLVFCLSVDEGIITGEVSDGISGEFLSAVNGTRQSLGPLGLDESASLMTLNYSKETTRIMMSGVIFERNFQGRFTTFAAEQPAAAGVSSNLAIVLPQAGSDGDTGTGTGTQT
ncbi:MAG TPA: hypothetical protein VFI24_06930 [Pyrinomonadaceae bacterium]|nr:hypothetical protein [Pyrinomonadaceae bacterium]